MLSTDYCLLTTGYFPLLVAFARVVGRARHGRGALDEAAVDEHLDLDAAVLLAPLARRVVGHGLQLAVAERRDDAAQRDVVVLDEVADDGVGAALRQAAVGLRRAV